MQDLLQALPDGLLSATLVDIHDYADRLDSRGLAAASRKLAAVKSLLSFAHETGYLPCNVGTAVRLPAVRNCLAERILPEADVLRLIHRARKPRDYALMLVLYSTSARVSEIAGLRWRECQARDGGGQLALFGKGGKSRTVLLGAAAWGRYCNCGRRRRQRQRIATCSAASAVRSRARAHTPDRKAQLPAGRSARNRFLPLAPARTGSQRARPTDGLSAYLPV